MPCNCSRDILHCIRLHVLHMSCRSVLQLQGHAGTCSNMFIVWQHDCNGAVQLAQQASRTHVDPLLSVTCKHNSRIPVINTRVLEATSESWLTTLCSMAHTSCFSLLCQLTMKPECTAAADPKPQPMLAASSGMCGTNQACSSNCVNAPLVHHSACISNSPMLSAAKL